MAAGLGSEASAVARAAEPAPFGAELPGDPVGFLRAGAFTSLLLPPTGPERKP